MPFRAIDRSLRLAALAAASVVCLSGALVGCDSNTAGSAAPNQHPDPAEPVPGIAPTRQDRIPADTPACVVTPTGDGDPTVATVSDPAAPRITITVPKGWQSTPGTGDTALMMSGPDTLSATVTIAATDLSPESAFLRYTAGVGGTMARRKFSVTGAPFCGYSSQQLAGTLQAPSGAIDFADRLAHIWTNTKQYLVTIHLESHSGVPGFPAAKSLLTQDFAVVIP
ncbi:MAG: hypothetical protein QOD58_3982 [Mycobacterium sp.]|nr:hypothetical protein [Mycobacterium sp.]